MKRWSAILCLLGLICCGCGESPTTSSGTSATKQNPSGTAVPVTLAGSACILTPAQLQHALAQWLEGTVTVGAQEQYTDSDLRCTYQLKLGGEDGSLVIDRSTYQDSAEHPTSIGRFVISGSTPQQAYANMLAYARNDSPTECGVAPDEHPDLAGGLVAECISFLLAGEGSYWYEVGLGAIAPRPDYLPALAEPGRAASQNA